MSAPSADPHAVAVSSAEAMYARDEASRALGIAVQDVAPGRATVRMTVTAAMVNGHGTCHGGYLFLLADTAFGLACNSHGEATVAAGADIVFVEPAHRGDDLVAVAVERVRRGRSGVYDVTVRRAGSSGAVVAEMRGRSRSLGRPVARGLASTTPDG